MSEEGCWYEPCHEPSKADEHIMDLVPTRSNTFPNMQPCCRAVKPATKAKAKAKAKAKPEKEQEEPEPKTSRKRAPKKAAEDKGEAEDGDKPKRKARKTK